MFFQSFHNVILSLSTLAVSPSKAARRMPRAPSIAEASEIGEDLDGQCVFCGEKDESFKEEGLDVHYWKFCPMLKRCGSCKQVGTPLFGSMCDGEGEGRVQGIIMCSVQRMGA